MISSAVWFLKSAMSSSAVASDFLDALKSASSLSNKRCSLAGKEAFTLSPEDLFAAVAAVEFSAVFADAFWLVEAADDCTVFADAFWLVEAADDVLEDECAEADPFFEALDDAFLPEEFDSFSASRKVARVTTSGTDTVALISASLS
jgi:hypothetical protein